MEPKLTHIYKIVSPTDRIYVGQTTKIKARMSKYRTLNCKSQRKLFNSLKRHGFDKHDICVIEVCDVKLGDERERYWQDFYDVCGDNGMNSRLTSTQYKKGKLSGYTVKRMTQKRLGSNHSEDTRRKISESNKGKIHSTETKNKISIILTGRKMSIDSKKKMSESGKLRLPNCRKAVIDLSTGVFFDSAKELSACFNLKYSAIVHKLNGITKNNTNYRYI